MEHEMMVLLKSNESLELKQDSLENVVKPFSLNERCHQLEIINEELTLTVKHQQQLINHLLNVSLRKNEITSDAPQPPATQEMNTSSDEKIMAEPHETEKAKPEFGEVYNRYCRLPLRKDIRKPTVQGQVRMLFKIYEAGKELEFGKANTSLAKITTYRYAKQLTELEFIRILYKDKKYFYAITDKGRLFIEGVK